MDTLSPTRYSGKTNSTFFEAGQLLITVSYELVQEKRFFVLPGSVRARIEASIGGGPAVAEHVYEIPRDRHVGDEITAVERGLYKFIDEVVRAAAQLQALEVTERAVAALEDEHLFEIESRADVARGEGSSRGKASAHVERLGRLVDRTLTAVRHLTNVTSLTREGLRAYQDDRSQALTDIWRASSLTSAIRVQGVLQAVEAFVRHEAESTTDVKRLMYRTREHLLALRRRQPELREAITPERVEIIVADGVPEFLRLKQRYDDVARVPTDIVGHAFGSFFGGGIAGIFTLDFIGEHVLEGLIGAPVDLPGFAIGAAVAFLWPYLRGAHGWFMRERWLERKREKVLQRLGRRLELSLPGPAGSDSGAR